MHRTIETRTLGTVVRGQQTAQSLRDVADTAVEAARKRMQALRLDDELGAQAAEYAMLGGVSAAACGGLVAILSNTAILEKLVKAVVSALVDSVGQWF